MYACPIALLTADAANTFGISISGYRSTCSLSQNICQPHGEELSSSRVVWACYPAAKFFPAFSYHKFESAALT
jgi:hypothetical protein